MSKKDQNVQEEQKNNQQAEVNEQVEQDQNEQIQDDNAQQELPTAEQLLMQAGEKIQELNKIIQDDQDKYLRLRAEFENYRKRTLQDNEKSKIKGIAVAIEAFFPAMDCIDRAIAVCKDESMGKGIMLVRKQFETALSTLGVTEINPVGEEFDPEFHNAVMNEVNPDMVGKVIDVFQKGYRYKETLLRPAMVKVGIDE